jgi:hypothetical protein
MVTLETEIIKYIFACGSPSLLQHERVGQSAAGAGGLFVGGQQHSGNRLCLGSSSRAEVAHSHNQDGEKKKEDFHNKCLSGCRFVALV